MWIINSYNGLTLCLFVLSLHKSVLTHVSGTARQGNKLSFHQGFEPSYGELNAQTAIQGTQAVYPIHSESHNAFILDGKIPITKEHLGHSFSIGPFSKGSWSPLEAPAAVSHPPAHKEKDLNIIFTPTAGDVSEVDKRIHSTAEAGMRNIRESLLDYSRLMQLLTDKDKHTKFYIGGDEYTLSTALETLNKLVEDGERVQRMIMQASSIILAKFAGSKSD